MGTIYEQPTTIERIVSMTMKYIIVTYYDNSTAYPYGVATDKDMFSTVGGAVNYNTNKQPSAPLLLAVQVYSIDFKDHALTLVHDIEV